MLRKFIFTLTFIVVLSTKNRSARNGAMRNSEVLEKMINRGMSVVQIDMEKGNTDELISLIQDIKKNIKEISEKRHNPIPIAILAAIKGPQILIGKFKTEKIMLKSGDEITLTVHPNWEDKSNEKKVFVDYSKLPSLVKKGSIVALDNGRIELRVRGTVDAEIVCDILTDGELKSEKNLIIKNLQVGLPPLNDKDKKDIKNLSNERVDALSLSGLFDKESFQTVRDVLGEKGKDVMLFSRIENSFAINSFDQILNMSDGIIVHRGRLSYEYSQEKVFQLQKGIIAKSIKVGKPVIVLTEYLNSMIYSKTPTLSEVYDASTSIIDGVDSIILNDETAIGDDPVSAVENLATLAREAEALIWHKALNISIDAMFKPPLDPAYAICSAALLLALKISATAIIVITTSGKTAQLMSRFKPKCPIFAVTRYSRVARQLNFWRGVFPLQYTDSAYSSYSNEIDRRIEFAIDTGKFMNIICPGDSLVLLHGSREKAGFCNSLRVVIASTIDAWTNPHSPVPQVSFKNRCIDNELYVN